MPQEPILVKVPEAARLLSLSKSKVYLMASNGELDAIHIGSSVRIPWIAVQALVQGHRA